MKTIAVYTMPILLDWDLTDLESMSDEEFKEISKQEGRVFNLDDFQQAFCLEEVSPYTDYIRFLKID